MKKRTRNIIIAILGTGVVLLIVAIIVILFSPYHCTIDVYPFDLTKVTGFHMSDDIERYIEYDDPSGVGEWNIYVSYDEVYDTIQALYSRMQSSTPHSVQWQQCVDEARDLQMVVVIDWYSAVIAFLEKEEAVKEVEAKANPRETIIYH